MNQILDKINNIDKLFIKKWKYSYKGILYIITYYGCIYYSMYFIK